MEFLGIRRGASGAIEVPSRLGEPCFEDAFVTLYGTRSEIHVRSMAHGQSIVVLGTAFHREFGTNLSLLPSDLCFDLESFLKDVYFQLFGRFIIIYSNQSKTLIFPDAGATRFLIYNERTGYFSSGISLAQEAVPWASKDETSSDESLIRKVTGHYNDFGFTGFDNCRCLLPNHFLNGKYFFETRFWPNRRNLIVDNNPKSNAWKKLDCELDFVTHSLFSLEKPILIPITSGRDSRTILAYFFGHGAKNIKTYTNLREGTKDLEYGRVLARSCGYDWSEVRPEGNHICLPGFGGEIFKLYWGQSLSKNNNDITERILRATPLFDRIRCNAILQFARHHVKNLIDLGLSEEKISDILYTELRWGCTMGEVHSKYDELFGLSFSFLHHIKSFNAPNLFRIATDGE